MCRVRGVRPRIRQRNSERVPPVHNRLQDGNVFDDSAGSSVCNRRLGTFGGVSGEDACCAN